MAGYHPRLRGQRPSVVGLAGEAIAAGETDNFVQDPGPSARDGLRLVLVHG
ncbi:MAG: hypothetical protein KF683_00615 [Rubrivivax sp.]|nr:hypothetical protein [Rubrivivax sp.]